MAVEIKAFPFQVKAEAGGRLTGLCATWDPDQVGDRIIPGAFAETIKERGPRTGPDGKVHSKIKMCYNHRHLIGLPHVMKETEHGLYVEGEFDPIPLAQDVKAQVGTGSLDSMSFAYDVLDVDYDPTSGERLLKQLRVYEFGPVDFPANEKAVITGLKYLKPDQLEAFLADLKAGKLWDDKGLQAIRDFTAGLKDAHQTLEALIAASTGTRPPAGPPPPPASEPQREDVDAAQFKALAERLQAYRERL